MQFSPKQLLVMKTSITFLFLSIALYTYAQPTFQKSIGGSSFEDAKSAAIVPDGSGFIAAGSSSSFSISFGAYIVKYNNSGGVLWKKIVSIAGNNSFKLASITRITDTSFALCGTASGINENKSDFAVIVINKNGDPLWARTIGGLKYDDAAHATKTTDNGIIVAGSSNSFGRYSKGSFYVVKLGLNGNLIWSKTFYNKQSNRCYSVTRTDDDGCVIAGSTKTFTDGSTPDAYVLKIDKNGNVQWNSAVKRTDSPEASEGEDIVQAANGSYIVAGYTTAGESFFTNIFLCRLNPNGRLVWSKKIKGRKEAEAVSIARVTGQSFVLGGKIDLAADFATRPYVAQFDISGNVTWSRTFNDLGIVSGINIASDNGIVAVGLSSRTMSPFDLQMGVAKLSASGNICNAGSSGGIVAPVTCSVYSLKVKVKDTGSIKNASLAVTSGGDIETLCSSSLANATVQNEKHDFVHFNVTAYPNPAKDYLLVQLINNLNSQQAGFQIINSDGAVVHKINTHLNSGANTKKIDTHILAPGLYILRVNLQGNVYNIKFVKQ